MNKNYQDGYLDNIFFNISEIFYSIQGEGTNAGKPCMFIRLQGCNYSCAWCDTEYAQDSSQKKLLNILDIYDKLQAYNCQLITVTGGEPLFQKDISALLNFLCDNNYLVALETNGYYNIKDIDERVIKIIDFKPPSSGMLELNNFENIAYLSKKDEIKFVLADKDDYNWAKKTIDKHKIMQKTENILFSAVFDRLAPSLLSEWILKDRLPVRLQLQLHKYIWSPDRRGV